MLSFNILKFKTRPRYFTALVGIAIGVLATQLALAMAESQIEIASLSYSPAVLKRRTQISNAQDERLQGWVAIEVTVGADGSWKGSRLMTSTGNKRLEKFALEAFIGSEWKPATVDGAAIESSEFRVFGMNSEGQIPPTREVVLAFKKISQAVATGDRELANQQLKKIVSSKAISSSDYVLFNLAEYEVAKKWGSKESQIDAIARIADGGKAAFAGLSQDVYDYYIVERFRLLLFQGHFAEAERLFNQVILNSSISESAKSQLQQFVDKISQSRKDGVRSEATVRLNEYGYGYFQLLKNESFLIKDGIRNIRELRMKCGGRSLLINIDANLLYRIKTDLKSCSIQIFGQSNSNITIFEP